MTYKSMIMAGIITGLLCLGTGIQAHDESAHMQLDVPEVSEAAPDHHALVHPFLAHMGLPDGPGEASFRGNLIRTVADQSGQSDAGFHIEAGLWDGVGIHLRNDAVSGNASTELMVQAAIWRDASKLSGIALFGEAEFGTGASSTAKFNFLYGISGRWVMLPVFSLDATLHYNPKDNMAEWESALVYRLTENIFPVFELSGELGQDTPLVNGLYAIKYKFGQQVFGVGIQYPLTDRKEFDSKLLVQMDISFH